MAVETPAGWYDDGSGSRRWWNGEAWTEWVDAPASAPQPESGALAHAAAQSAPAEGFAGIIAPAQATTRTRRMPVAAVLGIVLGGILLLGAAVVGAGAATADRWTKTDVPEHAQTFHTELFETGAFIVVDDGISPCHVDQDWDECRNLYVDEYNRECVGHDLTAESLTVCEGYGAQIDGMAEGAEPDWVVDSVGDYGYLQSTPETDTREVSNNDYRAAVVHEAVCYFGFIGECR